MDKKDAELRGGLITRSPYENLFHENVHTKVISKHNPLTTDHIFKMKKARIFSLEISKFSIKKGWVELKQFFPPFRVG